MTVYDFKAKELVESLRAYLLQASIDLEVGIKEVKITANLAEITFQEQNKESGGFIEIIYRIPIRWDK